jgi:hypothetical protein
MQPEAQGRWIRRGNALLIDEGAGIDGLAEWLRPPAVRRVYELASEGATPRDVMQELSGEYELEFEDEIWDRLRKAWPAIKQGAKKLGVVGRIVGLIAQPPADPMIQPPPPPHVVIETDEERRRRLRRQEMEVQLFARSLGF